MEENIIFNPENAKCKIKNEGRRMKIYIKLTKSETEGWNQIKAAFQGFPGTQDELVKMMFFRGVNAFMDDLKTQVEELSEEEKAEIIKEADEIESSNAQESETNN